MQGTPAIGSENRQDWGNARAAFIAIRDDVAERRMRGHSLRRIYRDLKPPISYGALTYHVRKADEEKSNAQNRCEIIMESNREDDVASPSLTTADSSRDKLSRLRRLGEKAGHHGKRAVYDPSANSHEDLFGPPKET